MVFKIDKEKLLHGHRNHMTRDNVIFIHEGRVAGGARTFQGVRFFDRDQNARRIEWRGIHPALASTVAA
jgi:hypothetical protein